MSAPLPDNELEALRDTLLSIEMLTATGDGLSPEECIHIHLMAGIARAYQDRELDRQHIREARP